MENNNELKISIITPSYNQGQFIEQTIKSVMNQNYANYEHIVVDGGSSDNTVEILKKYPHLKWVSEKDRGQSHAFNKGLKMASGDIIGWVNSDDFYVENIFLDVVSHFEDPDIEWIVGNTLNYYHELDYTEYIKSPRITYDIILKHPNYTRQPGTFHRKSLLEKAGGLDEDCDVVMDFELWVRLLKFSTPKMVDKDYCNFRKHADQKTSGKFILDYIAVISSVLKREKIPFSQRTKVLWRRYYSYFKYLVKYLLIKLKLIDDKYINLPLGVRKVVQ